ncbi:hypothetical protein [Oricola indica]|uniref:hypothetical protein n=1 Tax=Oricola indica TaxID=2872591 RepID=UPI003CCC1547
MRIAGGSGEGSFNAVELEQLLRQFREGEKSAVYRNYIGCLLRTMEMATNLIGLPPREIVLEGPPDVAPLRVLNRGQRVVLEKMDTVALNNISSLFTISSFYEGRATGTIGYRWSNSNTGIQKSGQADQGELIKLYEECNVIPYNVNTKQGIVSILINC